MQKELGLSLFDYALVEFPELEKQSDGQAVAVIARTLPHLSTRSRVVLSPDLQQSFGLAFDTVAAVRRPPCSVPHADTVLLNVEEGDVLAAGALQDGLLDAARARLIGLAVTKVLQAVALFSTCVA